MGCDERLSNVLTSTFRRSLRIPLDFDGKRDIGVDMKHGTIPPSWLGLTNMWYAERLLDLKAEVAKRGIAETDLPAVKAVWDELSWQDDVRRSFTS